MPYSAVSLEMPEKFGACVDGGCLVDYTAATPTKSKSHLHGHHTQDFQLNSVELIEASPPECQRIQVSVGGEKSSSSI